MGVIFFVINAAFALVLLVLVLVSSVYALISKNPDIRYQPMRDDRGSFIKSSSQMLPSTELDALGATARGDMKARDLEDDADSFSSPSQHQLQPQRSPHDASQVPLPPSTAGSNRTGPTFDMPHSPVGTSVPLFPTNSHDSSRQSPYAGAGQQRQQHHAGVPALLTPGGPRLGTASPAPQRSPSPRLQDGGGGGGYPQRGSPYQQQQSAPPQGNWQVGVGYSN